MTNGTSREQFAANYAIALAVQRHRQSTADERRRVKAIRQSQTPSAADGLSTKPKVEDGKSVTRTAQPKRGPP
jgi:hypothetical protein